MSLFLPFVYLLFGFGLAFGSQTEREAALGWMGNLSGEELTVEELVGYTAVSSFCSDLQKENIENRIRRWRKQTRQVTGEWQVYKLKVLGKYAGAVVQNKAERWSDGMGVHCLALIRGQAGWRVAPLPGSFQSTEIEYGEARERKVQSIEDWMMREAAKLKKEVSKKLAQDLKERANAPKWLLARQFGNGNAREMVDRFLLACEEGEIEVVLGDIGVLNNYYEEEEWKQNLVKEAFTYPVEEQVESYWYFLRENKQLVKWHLSETNYAGRYTVSMLAFNPLLPNSFENVSFTLIKVKGQWRLVFPPETWPLRDAFDMERGLDMEENFEAEVYALKYFETREEEFAPSAKGLGQALLGDLRGGDFSQIMRRVEAVEDEKEAKRIFRNLAYVFNKLGTGSHRSSQGVKLVELINGEQAALAIYTLFKLDKRRKVQVIPVLLCKKDEGWQISSGIQDPRYSNEGKKELKKLLQKFKKEKEGYQNKAYRSLYAHILMADMESLQLPSVKKVRKLMVEHEENLRSPIHKEKFIDVAILSEGESLLIALENLRYANKRNQKCTISAIHTAAPWMGLSIEIENASRKNYYLYIVSELEGKAYLFPEAELQYPSNGGKNLLNKQTFEHLSKILPDRYYKKIKELYEAHNQHCKGLISK